MRLTTRAKPLRCAYCFDKAAGELCPCGGAHIDCALENGSCPACGEHPTAQVASQIIENLQGRLQQRADEEDIDAPCSVCKSMVKVPSYYEQVLPDDVVVCGTCQTVGPLLDLSAPRGRHSTPRPTKQGHGYQLVALLILLVGMAGWVLAWPWRF